MEEGILTPVKEPELIKDAVDNIVLPMGYKNIKANIEEFETPSRLNRSGDDTAFIPDITGVINGRKSYFEIALKTEKMRPLITKWKLLSKIAAFKRGKLFLIVPHGNYAFTERILKKYGIKAKILKA